MPCGYRSPLLPWTPRSRKVTSLWVRLPREVYLCGVEDSPALSWDMPPQTITYPAAPGKDLVYRWPGRALVTARLPPRTKHRVRWTLKLVARRDAHVLSRSLVKQWVLSENYWVSAMCELSLWWLTDFLLFSLAVASNKDNRSSEVSPSGQHIRPSSPHQRSTSGPHATSSVQRSPPSRQSQAPPQQPPNR